MLTGIVLSVCLFLYLTDNTFIERMFTLEKEIDVAISEENKDKTRIYFLLISAHHKQLRVI